MDRALVAEVAELFAELFPICRSLTGDGVRATLRRLQEVAHFNIHEVPSGTQCYDWTVPDEWSIRRGWIEADGKRIVDFADSNLHVVNYSTPVDLELSFDELAPRLHTLPACPDAIPYRTSYYKRDWGFCLSQRQFDSLDRSARYRVHIDSTLEPGSLTYGEAILPGEPGGDEYLISTYCCHPSLANDNLSGPICWALLLRELARRPRRHTYRFVINPESIGAVVYLHRNAEAMKRVKGGYVVTCTAGPGNFGYKHSFLSTLDGTPADVDWAALHALREAEVPFDEFPFDIIGSDERQYSASGWRIPIGSIHKDKYYEFVEYHTSLDNLDFVQPEGLVQTLDIFLSAIGKLESNCRFRTLVPQCDPMLSKRNLYPSTGGALNQKAVLADKEHHKFDYNMGDGGSTKGASIDGMLWLSFLGDGRRDLFDVAELTGISHRKVVKCFQALLNAGVVERV